MYFSLALERFKDFACLYVRMKIRDWKTALCLCSDETRELSMGVPLCLGVSY